MENCKKNDDFKSCCVRRKNEMFFCFLFKYEFDEEFNFVKNEVYIKLISENIRKEIRLFHDFHWKQWGDDICKNYDGNFHISRVPPPMPKWTFFFSSFQKYLKIVSSLPFLADFCT